MKSIKKKSIYTGLAILGLIATIGVGSVYARDAIIRNNSIDGADAKKFALIDAGVSEKDVTYTEIDFEKENGNYIYDIEFVANGVKYYYHVNASDGRILAKGKNTRNMIDVEDEEVFLSPVTNEETASTPAAVQVEQTANPTKASAGEPAKQEEQRKDDQTSNVVSSSTTTNASTNNTSKAQAEVKKETPKANPASANVTTSGTYISLDKVKEIALKHAGVALNSAIFEAAKLEEDNGRTKYDIEFFTSTKEYDYEIDAFTGKIIEYSFEKQDKLPSNIVNKIQQQNTTTNNVIYENEDLEDVVDDLIDFDDDHDDDDRIDEDDDNDD